MQKVNKKTLIISAQCGILRVFTPEQGFCENDLVMSYLIKTHMAFRALTVETYPQHALQHKQRLLRELNVCDKI